MCKRKRTYLRRLMDADGYILDDVARALGISKGTALLKVNGERDVTTQEMWKIAKLLRMDNETMLRAFPPGGVAATILK